MVDSASGGIGEDLTVRVAGHELPHVVLLHLDHNLTRLVCLAQTKESTDAVVAGDPHTDAAVKGMGHSTG